MARHAKSLYFTGPGFVCVEAEDVPTPGATDVLIESATSGISAGTELNVYRGYAPQWRQSMDPKTRLFSSDGASDWNWPARYGYASVGRIVELGQDVDGVSLGDWVFSYSPHGTHAVAAANAVVPLSGLSDPQLGIFFANLNTAYNGVLDANLPLGGGVWGVGDRKSVV